ncbi:MAG TPA: MFS transporter [Candidatus Microbacterium pullistercoris]|nr:MFS transporter [Candidatus Microbacterium pullistercoris]
MKRVVLLALAQCLAMGALTAPAVVGLSVRVREFVEPDAAAGLLGAIISLGSLAAMIANPLFGWLADHTGRRRGALTLGAVAGLVATVGVAWAPSPVALAAAWITAQAAYNMCFGAINGLISHGLADTDRTRAAGVLSSVSILGTLPGLAAAALLPHDVAAMMLVVPTIAAVAIPILALRLPRSARVDGAAPSRRPMEVVRTVASRAFVVVITVRFVIAFELAAGLVFALYLFTDRWQIAETDAVPLVSLMTAVGAVGLVATAAIIAASPLRRAPARVLLGSALVGLAVATLARALAPNVLIFLLATLVAGCAIGAGFTATRSIAQAVLPPERSALGLGVFNVANTLAPAVAPVVAGALVVPGLLPWQTDGYGAMYLALSVPIVACLALLPLLRQRRAAVASPHLPHMHR